MAVADISSVASLNAKTGATEFDVDANFKIQGNPDSPAGLKSILFTPSLTEKSREEIE